MTKRRLSDPPEAPMLSIDQLDDLGLALITLARELWVVIDRQAVLEKLLERHGIGSAEIDAFQPDPALAATLEERRRAYLDTVLGALQGRITS